MHIIMICIVQGATSHTVHVTAAAPGDTLYEYPYDRRCARSIAATMHGRRD